MRADEGLFLVEERSCSGHHRKGRFWPTADIGWLEILQRSSLLLYRGMLSCWSAATDARSALVC